MSLIRSPKIALAVLALALAGCVGSGGGGREFDDRKGYHGGGYDNMSVFHENRSARDD